MATYYNGPTRIIKYFRDDDSLIFVYQGDSDFDVRLNGRKLKKRLLENAERERFDDNTSQRYAEFRPVPPTPFIVELLLWHGDDLSHTVRYDMEIE
mmetsp:Transcript_6191/g.6747  ORF Transcript_6191/g.6747 Transcript_6191/m.6747 type:complete len:96 (+) Transcript_6191:25-312(+)